METLSQAYTHALLPVADDVVLDEGLRDVVDHERLVREHLHELLCHGEVLRVDEDVVGEVVLLQKANATQKVLAEEKGVVRFVLYLPYYLTVETAQCDGYPSAWRSSRRRRATVKVRDDAYSLIDVLRAKIHPSHDALDYVRVLLSQVQKELCFFLRLASLHSYRSVHSVATDAGFQLRGKKVSSQRLHVLVQPGKGLGVVASSTVLPPVHRSKSADARRCEGST